VKWIENRPPARELNYASKYLIEDEFREFEELCLQAQLTFDNHLEDHDFFCTYSSASLFLKWRPNLTQHRRFPPKARNYAAAQPHVAKIPHDRVPIEVFDQLAGMLW